MVQITAESMAALKKAMKEMKDYTIECGSITVTSPDEVVEVQWVRDDKNINIGYAFMCNNYRLLTENINIGHASCFYVQLL